MAVLICHHAARQWRPGGRGAHLVLEEFVVQRMPHFSTNRAKTDVRSTSRLSPHLHHGEISTRHNYYVVSVRREARQPSAQADCPMCRSELLY